MKNFSHVIKSKRRHHYFNQKKLNGFEHVWYEIFFYNDTRNFLLTKGNHIPTLESFLLHMRSLKDFFERTKNKIGGSKKTIIKYTKEDDDIIAEDYGYKAKRISLGSNIRQRLNKELVHLTYKRNKEKIDNKLWYINNLGISNFNKRCTDFIKYMKENFSDYINFEELDGKWQLSKYINYN